MAVVSFPGLEINEVGGRTFAKGGAEWTLPPLRFRKFGFTNFYATWLRLAFFGNGIVTNPDRAAWRREVWDVGVQMNLKLVLFFSLESTLSAGYARAFEDALDPRDEVHGLAQDPALMPLLAKGLLGMTPVVLYLVALVILDSYKLVKLRAVILAVAAGWAALVACHFINGFLLTVTGLDLPTFSRYIAPVTEETTKAAYLVFLIRTQARRVHGRRGDLRFRHRRRVRHPRKHLLPAPDSRRRHLRPGSCAAAAPP